MREHAPLNEIYIVSGPVGHGGTGSNGGVTKTVAGRPRDGPAYTWKVALVLPDNGTRTTSRASPARRQRSPSSCPTSRASRAIPLDDLSDDRRRGRSADRISLLHQPAAADPELHQGRHQRREPEERPDHQLRAARRPARSATTSRSRRRASSGLAVTLTVTSGPATIVSGTTLHITGAGTGDRPGHAGRRRQLQRGARRSASRSRSRRAARRSPSTRRRRRRTYGDPAFQVSATGGASGNPVTFTASVPAPRAASPVSRRSRSSRPASAPSRRRRPAAPTTTRRPR